jgi:hypothetical protein
MKNHDFATIIILILLNSFVSTQEIKQIVINPMPNHQFPEIQSIDLPEIQSIDLPEIQSIDLPEIQSIDLPEIQSIDLPPIHIQESDTNITLSIGLKWRDATAVQKDSLLIAKNEELSELLRQQRKKEDEERKKGDDDDLFEIYFDLLVAILKIMAALGEIWG